MWRIAVHQSDGDRWGVCPREFDLTTTIACSLAWKTIAVFVLAVLPVSVKTNSGTTVEGNLDGFTTSSLLLNRSGQVIELGFDDLSSLRPTELEDKTGPTYRVMLVGGSSIAAQNLSLVDSQLEIELRRQNKLRVPISQVKAIRFRAPSVATDSKWLGIIEEESRGDKLVIRRPGDRIDPQQGVAESIADGKVVFDLDGDKVNAPVDRLEGVVFGGSRGIVEDADIQVLDVYGSRWSVISIEPSKGDQPLQLRLSHSLLHEVPLHQIESIRWSGGITLLAEEKPVSDSFQPYFPTDINTDLWKNFFGPVRDQEADLLMVGGSAIEYRIEPGHRILAGSVRRNQNVTKAGEVTVRIEIDGKSVWQETLLDAEPRGFELPVEDSRRLAIKVDSEQDGDLGDSVRISRPRLLK